MSSTNDIIRSLAVCAGPGCQGCCHLGYPAESCIKQLVAEAHAALTAAQDRCARYAEEIMVLRELAEADKEGRVVVLPCKVGDGLWAFCSHPVEQVYSFTVTDISTLNGRTMLNTSRCGVIDARDVGKTVFLTREEAKKALEAWKDG